MQLWQKYANAIKIAHEDPRFTDRRWTSLKSGDDYEFGRVGDGSYLYIDLGSDEDEESVKVYKVHYEYDKYKYDDYNKQGGGVFITHIDPKPEGALESKIESIAEPAIEEEKSAEAEDAKVERQIDDYEWRKSFR